LIITCQSTHTCFTRSDFADNEQIEELLAWTHPHLESPSAGGGGVIFTEAENAAMLRLPRKECTHTRPHLFLTVFIFQTTMAAPGVITDPFDTNKTWPFKQI
jgi:hypothetical protein